MQDRRGPGGQPDWPPMMEYNMPGGMGPAALNMGSMLPVSQSSIEVVLYAALLNIQQHKLLLLTTDSGDTLCTPVREASQHFWTTDAISVSVVTV